MRVLACEVALLEKHYSLARSVLEWVVNFEKDGPGRVDSCVLRQVKWVLDQTKETA